MRKVNRTESGCTLSASAGSLALERDGATGRYSVLSRGLALAESGRSAALAAPDGSASQLWGAVGLRRLLRAPLNVGARPQPRERQRCGGQPRPPVRTVRDARPAPGALPGPFSHLFSSI